MSSRCGHLHRLEAQTRHQGSVAAHELFKHVLGDFGYTGLLQGHRVYYLPSARGYCCVWYLFHLRNTRSAISPRGRRLHAWQGDLALSDSLHGHAFAKLISGGVAFPAVTGREVNLRGLGFLLSLFIIVDLLLEYFCRTHARMRVVQSAHTYW